MHCLKKIFVLIFMICSASSLFAATEADLMLRDSLKDLKLKQVYRTKDQRLRQTKSAFLDLLNRKTLGLSCQEKCESLCSDNDNSGGGSASCWEQCTKEGYSSGTCSNRCGTDTSGGSQSCWDQCAKEGYSSGTCSDRCGTGTSGGSEACWKQCTKEGYSSGTCADRCGTN